MKKEILDAPFRDSFEDFLEKGETILWQGQPKKESLFSFSTIFGLIYFLTFAYLPPFLSPEFFISTLFGSIVFLSLVYPKYELIEIKKNMNYGITQHRIFFQQKRKNQFEVFDIPLKNIIRVSNQTNFLNFKTGDIFVFINNKKDMKFRTYSLMNKEEQEIISIQQIENPQEVLQLIRDSIKIASTSA